MTEEGTEERPRLLAVKLPLALWRYLESLEAMKNEKLAEAERIHEEALAIEARQTDRIAGYFEGANLGPFDPNAWSFTDQGVMNPIIKAVEDEEPPKIPVVAEAD